MLVLSRKNDQSILIGDDIEIMVVGIEKGQVKLGISAPKHVDIKRKELVVETSEQGKEKTLVKI